MTADMLEDLHLSQNLSELKDKVKKYNLTKGDLMHIVYAHEVKNVDSAIPKEFWESRETFWYVMDYNSNSLGNLVHLGEAILSSSYAKTLKGKSISIEDLHNYIGEIFIPIVYLKDVMTDEPIGKGNQYRLRKVFKGNYASFDDLDDRSADTYKYQRQPIISIHFDDIHKLKLINS